MVEATHTAELLRIAAAAHPDRDAYVHGDKRATYAWLDQVADGFAATLIERGVEPGDVVGLMLASSIKFAACYLGALRAGAITSAINGRLGEHEQRSILERTEPMVTVVGDGARVPDGAPVGRVIRVEDLKAAFGAAPVELPEIGATDAACIVWTSGTTGIPKGAVYDHARLRAISNNIGQLTEPGDRRLVVLPFPHVGYMTRMWDELANGTTIVIASEPWSAAETLRLIRDEHITMGTGVPTQWELVLAHPDIANTDFSGLRVVGTGGATIAPDLIRRMRETLRCPVISRYTSTEAGVTTSTVVGDPDDVIATTVGRPAPDVELRILLLTGDVGDGDGGDGDGGDGDVGEILSRSPTLMREYWRDPETTAATIDADGWLHTGDLGVIGVDGNLRIVGRLKEMYIRGGYNVYPAEVEATLADHPGIAQVAVIGASRPVLGEIGVAFVVPTDAQHPPDLATLRDWCRSRIADYKAPDELLILDALPLNATNKVDKVTLAAKRGAPKPVERALVTPERKDIDMAIQEVGSGDTRVKPIKLGGALVTIVEPHPGHEVEYNRWYERDHFYAGCMIGAWTISGTRYVATRAHKDLRFPADSTVATPLDHGSYVAIYWVLAGKFGEWIRWGTDQVNWLHENERMFPHRDHVHTAMYKLRGESHADADGVPVELALDRGYPGLVIMMVEPPAGADGAWLIDWVAQRPPAPADQVVAMTSVPLLADAPPDVPLTPETERVCLLWFDEQDPIDRWDGYQKFATDLETAGGRVAFAAPFIKTLPGTDTYTDQLW